MASDGGVDMRVQAIEEYKRKLLQHKELDSKVRSLRDDVKKAKGEYDKTEDDLKALQSVGQIIGEVLKQLDEERCKYQTSWTLDHFHLPHKLTKNQPIFFFPPNTVIVKSSSGPRYVVGCRSQVDQTKLKPNTRVALDVTTLTIMRILPREVRHITHALSSTVSPFQMIRQTAETEASSFRRHCCRLHRHHLFSFFLLYYSTNDDFCVCRSTLWCSTCLKKTQVK